MNVALEVHLGFAFFVFLVALFVGWVQMGRRTMSAILGIQILIGIVAAVWLAIAHYPLPPTLWIHIVGALAAMFAYIAGRRVYDRGNAGAAVGLSLLGFVLLCFTIWYGWHVTYR
jgi:hypothetical protein